MYQKKEHLFFYRFVYFSTSHKYDFREKRGQQDDFLMKKSVVFSSILTFSIEKLGFPILFMLPEDSPWKTASSDVKISKRNDTRDVNDRFFFDPSRQPDPSMIEPGPLHGLSNFFFDPRVASRVEDLLTRHGLPAG